jgi:plasmid maintenance system antidote protein VapI
MNRGALHLAGQVSEWIQDDPEHRSQNAAAAATGCDTGNFSKILQGKRLPGRTLATKIKQVFGTEPEWFDEPAQDGSSVEGAA